jgi:branched-chain amino acid transport system permease protein
VIFSGALVGLASGMIYVLIATGLTLTYGIMRIVNMAHGAFFTLGAYALYTISRHWSASVPHLVLGVIVSMALVGLCGAVAEPTIYRRMYAAGHLSGLLGTFALLIFVSGLVEFVWGSSPVTTPVPGSLNHSVKLWTTSIPVYDLFILGCGLLLALALAAVLRYTRLGLEARAVATDRQMAAVLGIRVNRVFVITFVIGCALAAAAGALLAPLEQLDGDIGSSFVLLAFAVVIVGGPGSVTGTVLAGLLLGIIDGITSTFVPALSGYTFYLAMVVLLLVRPQGILGKAGLEIR